MQALFVLLALAGAGAYYYKQKKTTAAERLKYEPRGVKVTGKFPAYKLELLLDVVNPSATPINIDKLFIDVFANTSKVGAIDHDKPIIVPAGQTSHFKIPVKLKIGAALTSFLTAILDKKPITIDVTGLAHSEGFEVDINKSFKLAV